MGLAMGLEADYLKHVDRAPRGYLAAIKALARVRRIDLPAVQVNIGERQINAGGCSSQVSRR